MIDLEYLAFLENILTDNRKENFKKYCKTEPNILQLLWRIFSNAIPVQ
jgi:hypothetical protein